MKNFELFIGCLGNGLTVCNKAVEENGDYKKIAHIAECGKIHWYVKPSTIPGNELLKIEHHADVQAHKWEESFNKMSEFKQYEFLLDNVPLKDFLEAVSMKCDIFGKIQFLKQAYYRSI